MQLLLLCFCVLYIQSDHATSFIHYNPPICFFCEFVRYVATVHLIRLPYTNQSSLQFDLKIIQSSSTLINLVIWLLFVALLDYVNTAPKIEIRSSSVRHSSVRIAIISVSNVRISLKLYLLLSLGHTIRCLVMFWKQNNNKKKKHTQTRGPGALILCLVIC